MLELIQIIISSKNKSNLSFTNNSDWSDNILPENAIAYELTINGDIGNKFSLNNSKEPFTIDKDGNNTTIPLAIYLHVNPALSLHINKKNSYRVPTIINVLINSDKKNYDQYLHQVNFLQSDLNVLQNDFSSFVSNDFVDIKNKVKAMYGLDWDAADEDIGQKLLNLKNVVIGESDWENNSGGKTISSVIGRWSHLDTTISDTLTWNDYLT